MKTCAFIAALAACVASSSAFVAPLQASSLTFSNPRSSLAAAASSTTVSQVLHRAGSFARPLVEILGSVVGYLLGHKGGTQFVLIEESGYGLGSARDLSEIAAAWVLEFLGDRLGLTRRRGEEHCRVL